MNPHVKLLFMKNENSQGSELFLRGGNGQDLSVFPLVWERVPLGPLVTFTGVRKSLSGTSPRARLWCRCPQKWHHNSFCRCRVTDPFLAPRNSKCRRCTSHYRRTVLAGGGRQRNRCSNLCRKERARSRHSHQSRGPASLLFSTRKRPLYNGFVHGRYIDVLCLGRCVSKQVSFLPSYVSPFVDSDIGGYG